MFFKGIPTERLSFYSHICMFFAILMLPLVIFYDSYVDVFLKIQWWFIFWQFFFVGLMWFRNSKRRKRSKQILKMHEEYDKLMKDPDVSDEDRVKAANDLWKAYKDFGDYNK